MSQLGLSRDDPYAWLRAENWQEVMHTPTALPADIGAYLEAENHFTKTELETPHAALCDTLLKEMRGRIKEDASSVPQKDGPWAYATRYREGGEYPIFYRVPSHDTAGEQQILFDGDTEAKQAEYYDLGDLEHSPNHARLGWSVDTKGSEYYTIYTRDITTGAATSKPITLSTGDFVWNAASDSLFWVKRDESGRASSLWRRVLSEETDTLIYEESDPAFSVSLAYSDSGTYILVIINSHTTSEIHYFPKATDGLPKLICISPRETDHEYAVSDWQGRWIIRTNADGAVDFKLMQADIGTTARAAWTQFLPHVSGRLILGVEAFTGYLVREERVDGLPQIIIQAQTGAEHTLKFDEAAYDLDVISGYEYDTDVLRIGYASPTTPDQVFDYNMTTQERVLLKTREIPSGHTPEDYVVERIFAPAKDGAQIPLTVLRHKTTPLDGTAPTLLYGYGSYGITISADFRTGRLSLVDRGFVYVIAHIRGGMAKGYQWYLDGKLEKKQNTFTDFVAAAEYLIDQKYTYTGGIIAHGGSAGGLLVGAAINIAPEVFGGVMAAVPFVDVLTTMSDADLPLTPPEWPEWGNPIISTQDYQTILAYSPYDQVGDKPYPPMLITGGLTDPRVTYWEPAKWAAKLRHEAPNGGPYYLKINMGAGHGGATGRFEGLKEVALEYAFALTTMGKA